MLLQTTVQYLLHRFRICLFMSFFLSYLNNTGFASCHFNYFFSLYPRFNINHADFRKFPFDYKYSKEIIFSFNYYYCMTRSAGSRWRRELRNVSSIPRDWKPRACVLLAFCLVFTTTLLVQVTHWRLPARPRRLNCFVCLWWRAWNSCEPYWEWDK